MHIRHAGNDELVRVVIDADVAVFLRQGVEDAHAVAVLADDILVFVILNAVKSGGVNQNALQCKDRVFHIQSSFPLSSPRMRRQSCSIVIGRASPVQRPYSSPAQAAICVTWGTSRPMLSKISLREKTS